MTDGPRTPEALASKLRTLKTIQATILVVFAVILLTWVVLGYWRSNVPLFVSTVGAAVSISAAIVASRRSLRAELKKREEEANQRPAGTAGERE